MTELPPLPRNPVTFDRPPVAEVALAVQFAAPVTDEATTLGRFWPKIRARFPVVETQPVLPPMSEDFTAAPQPQVLFQMLTGPSSPRFWLQTEDRAGLLQVQPDRIAYNWRKAPGDFPYPRYEQIRRTFFEMYDIFSATCAEQGREPVPTWCEVTYINPIEVAAGVDYPDLATILRRLQAFDLLDLGTPEDANFNERYVLMRNGDPYGRFYVSAVPSVRVFDEVKLVLLTLTARGVANPASPEGVVAFVDEGRSLIVNGFKAMTTDAMHREWGLRDGD
jgi:uncharacterized protein (TIGR04255 family)